MQVFQVLPKKVFFNKIPTILLDKIRISNKRTRVYEKRKLIKKRIEKLSKTFNKLSFTKRTRSIKNMWAKIIITNDQNKLYEKFTIN